MVGKNLENPRFHRGGDIWIKLYKVNWIPTGEGGGYALQVKEIILSDLKMKKP